MAFISKYSGLNSAGCNLKHGWRAYATRELAEADQQRYYEEWRDGVEERTDVKPGDEWEGS